MSDRRSLFYFDNASSSKRSKYFLEEYKKVFGKSRSDERKLELFKRAEKKLAELLGDKENTEIHITFVPNATYAINEIAYYLTPDKSIINPQKIKKQIYLSDSEHAANHLVWLNIAEKPIIYLPLKDFSNWQLPEEASIFSFSAISNLEGIKVKIEEINKKFEDKKHVCIVDASQLMPHSIPNFKTSSIDYLFFSAHKFFGPNGIGVICSRENTDLGINSSNFEKKQSSYLLDLDSLEAWINSIDVTAELFKSGFIANEIEKLNKYFISNFPKENSYLELLNPDTKNCIFLLKIKHEHISSHDYCFYLEKHGIITRAGISCSWLSGEKYDAHKIFRVSLSPFNSREEIDFFIKIIDYFSPESCL